MACPRTVTVHLTSTQLTLEGPGALTLTLQGISHLSVRTESGVISLTPFGMLPGHDDLTIIPGLRTATQRFHPYSEGASLCDYVAYVMLLPDVTLPVRLTDLETLLRDRTAAHFRRTSNIHSAMDRDPRFNRQDGRWTLSERSWAAMQGGEA